MRPTLSFTSSAALGAMLTAFTLQAAPGTVSVPALAAETQGRQTLRDLQSTATAAATDADQLKFFARTPLSPETHAQLLNDLKDRVNHMESDIQKLEAERDSLPPSEQQAIDRVAPLARDAALETISAIDCFRDNKGRLWAVNYGEIAGRIGQDSSRIAKTLKGLPRP